MLPLIAMYENQMIPKGIKTIVQYYSRKNNYNKKSIKNTINQTYNQKQSTKHNKKQLSKTIKNNHQTQLIKYEI